MIEIPQDSFRLYFRDVCGVFKWQKLFQGDIICDKNLLLEFLGNAITQSLVWTMDHFDIFFENCTSYQFNTPTEDQILYAIDNATPNTIQEIGEAGIPFQVFFRPVGKNKWIWMPKYNSIVCDLNHITELTLYGLMKDVLSNLDRFDIYYTGSEELPEKVDVDALVKAIQKEAGKN
ncbi:hypothetical protein [Sporomusa termitida]|uniref:Uncharacterized protein n=1 Tax=Sporomusa termitida TaxID=2377 RepID=A0A517DVJ8_9FIRM|nr:hypothetical protein [Sporomusa termitida]QDR81382.1 hypothetical protein SPTER_27610 [Sporomusa termitida]